VPDEFGAVLEIMGNCVPRIVIAVAAWKYDDTDFHFVNRCSRQLPNR
jgi:hypothetical protein